MNRLLLIASPDAVDEMIVFLEDGDKEDEFLQAYRDMFGGQPRVVAQANIENLPPAIDLGRPFVG